MDVKNLSVGETYEAMGLTFEVIDIKKDENGSIINVVSKSV